MKEKTKTIIAFSVLAIMIIVGFVLSGFDKPTDVFPNHDTKICLYGETHGAKEYYDIEFDLWKGYYDQGYRSLFVELPYYSAEFLNLWMKEDSDETIMRWFEEIQGTLSGKEAYLDFFRRIKENCPDTVFYGTDVGHQYDTTGARYLKYLAEHDLTDTGNYELAQECIAQGKEYYETREDTSGMSPVREAYMMSNFINAYDRCGEEKIMGIYGGYHTELGNPELMAGRLRAHYGDVISSVKLSTLAFGKNEPYRFGISITGVVFLALLFIPNIIWAKRGKPADYEESAKKENKVLLFLERIGEAAVSVALLVFPAANPYIKSVPEGVFFELRLFFWVMAFVLMCLYECYWIRYFKSRRTMKDLYASFAGFPVAGASLPVMAVILLGIYSRNMVFICGAAVLGIGHIGIHLVHRKECNI